MKRDHCCSFPKLIHKDEEVGSKLQTWTHKHTHTRNFRQTFRAVDAGVLVVAQEEALFALALVAAHGVYADLLASAVVVLTLIHIYKTRQKDKQLSACAHTHTHAHTYAGPPSLFFFHPVIKSPHRYL